jgi:serine/threonine-protein kinase
MTHDTPLPVICCAVEPAQSVPFPPAETCPVGFQRLQLAGRGSFCETWKVRETATGVHYACKQLLADCVDDEGARRLLINESLAGQSVTGRHVVRVTHSDHSVTPPYNLLEWCDGQTLQQSLDAGQTMSIGSIVWIARQCAQGLNELAQAGYSHGDVKPENVLLAENGEVKLVDLGFAESLTEPLTKGQAYCMTGTPEYMAPELCQRGVSNPLLRDVYSLGIMLFQLLAGRLPFQAPTVERMLRLHSSARPPVLRDLCPGAPAELILLVERMIAKQPIRRPQSYSSLIRELTALELETLHARFAA